jgi:hypothetical protein
VFPLCFDVENRPDKLVLVLAGRQLPGFKPLVDHPVYGPLIRSKTSLSGWTDEHVKDFLKLHGKGNLTPEHMELLVNYVKTGAPIANVLVMADGLILTYG